MLKRFKSSVTFLMKLLAFLLCGVCFFGLFGLEYFFLLRPSRTLGVTAVAFIVVYVLMTKVYGGFDIGKRKSKPIVFSMALVLLLTVGMFLYLKYSKQGYEISVVGDSHATAKYAGIPVKRVMLRTMFFSGAICGIAGMVQATGSDMTLATSVAGGVGFTAIIVAWLAQLNPPVILLVTFLFSVLEKGSSVVQSSFGLSSDCADVLQGIILFFILGSEFFINYRVIPRGAHKEGK